MRFIRFMQGNLPEDREKRREQILKDIFGEEEWQELKRRRQPDNLQQHPEEEFSSPFFTDDHQRTESFSSSTKVKKEPEIHLNIKEVVPNHIEDEAEEEFELDDEIESQENEGIGDKLEPEPRSNSISSFETPKTHEEILNKNTHYIFIFGYTGAGKSTVLTALNMYMRQHYRVILNQMENQEGIRLVHEMMRGMEEGQFPQPTSIGTITEYDTAFSINGHTVNLTFLEMAGEDLKKVDVETGDEGLDPHVHAFLSCPGISISFLIVADYQRVITRKEDKLILQFLSYLYNEGIDMSRVGVILSKFDRDRTDTDVEEVIKTYLPQVDKWLTSGDIAQPKIFPFSVGEVRSQKSQKDEIIKMDLEDCSEIVPWLHKVLSLPSAPTPSPKPKKGLGFKIKNLLGL